MIPIIICTGHSVRTLTALCTSMLKKTTITFLVWAQPTRANNASTNYATVGQSMTRSWMLSSRQNTCIFRRPVGPGEGANISIMTMDFWSTRMAMRNNIVQPTTNNPPHQMSKRTRFLPPLARIGTTTMNNTSGGVMRRCFILHMSYQMCWSRMRLFQIVSQSIFHSTSRWPGRHREHRLQPYSARTATVPTLNR
jgi:hypothetical protein